MGRVRMHGGKKEDRKRENGKIWSFPIFSPFPVSQLFRKMFERQKLEFRSLIEEESDMREKHEWRMQRKR